jgi:hypothetical protein
MAVHRCPIGCVIHQSLPTHAGWLQAYSCVLTDLTLLPSGVQKSEPLRDSPNLALLGQYMASTFAMPSDGHGEKVIADPALSQQLSLVPPHA